LVERFKLSKDGKQLIYSGTMNDPEYLSEAVQFSSPLDYSSDLKHFNEKCNLEVARRFLKEDQGMNTLIGF